MFRGLRRWRLRDFLPRDSCSPLCCNHSTLEKRAVKPVALVRDAGRLAGQVASHAGNGPAPLWRLLPLRNWLDRQGFRGTGLLQGGAWEAAGLAAVEPEG